METLVSSIDVFSLQQLIIVGLVFVWSGFVRTGLGFGGAGLALPFLLLVKGDPVFWLPVFGFHLLFFSSITVVTRLSNVNWSQINQSIWILLIPKIAGVLGLLTLPPAIMVVTVYGITLFYAFTYILNWQLNSQSIWRDRLFLIFGGYMSGTTLMGAALIAPVISNRVSRHQYRDTLFVLWIILVLIKMSAFVIFDVPLNWQFAIAVAPCVAVGHYLGLKAHDALISGDEITFKRALGVGLAVVSFVGLFNAL
ncbi:MAG: putative membrane protein YfcA [Saprospiraceae bacterium]|jgi:uncharacterized membrane protein YfcA